MRDFLIGFACLSWLIFFFFSTPIGRKTFKIGAWGLGILAVMGAIATAGGIGYFAGERAERAAQADAKAREKFWASVPRECWDLNNCKCSETRKTQCWGEPVSNPF